MIREILLLTALVALTGCAVNGQRLDYVPKVLSEEAQLAETYRAEAHFLVSGKIPDGRLNHIDQTARIKLEPSPGQETIFEEGSETLTSMPNGGYFAFITNVPFTQYFKIVRKADCDEWGTMSAITPQVIKNNRNLLLHSDKYHGNKPWFECFPAFDDYYRNGDKRLIDTDGVLFDIDTITINERVIHWSLLSNQVKVHLDGWAIKFIEPTDSEIREHLKYMPPRNPAILKLQFKSAIYWIEKNRATQYYGAMLSLLPTRSPDRDPNDWATEDEYVLQTLAMIAPMDISDDIWMGFIDKGGRAEIDPARPIVTSAKSSPLIAANVIACKAKISINLLERFTRVLAGPFPFQHKQAAATALRTLGYADVVKKYSGFYGSLLWKATSGTSVFACPFRGAYASK